MKGSYTIIDVSSTEGIKLVRDGNIPGFLFDQIFETPIDRSSAYKSKHEQLVFPTELIDGLSPSAIRIAIISYARGQNIEHIRKQLQSKMKT